MLEEDNTGELIKYHKLYLKHLCLEKSSSDEIYKNCKISDLVLLYTIYDLVETEKNFFYLSDEVTKKIDDIFNIIRWNIKDERLTQIINELVIYFREFRKKSFIEKKMEQQKYLQEDFIIRSRTEKYYNTVFRLLDNNMYHLSLANIAFQKFDYQFFWNAMKLDFNDTIRNEKYFDFIFSLNYFINYNIEALFTEDKKELYLDTLKEIEHQDRSIKVFTKLARKHLKEIY